MWTRNDDPINQIQLTVNIIYMLITVITKTDFLQNLQNEPISGIPLWIGPN